MTNKPERTIGAIETAYKGIKFRSRLEARWAVFYDSLGIEWEYEKEGYSLPSGYYLPDFWLPKQQCWIEIKGQSPTEQEETLSQQLSQVTGRRAFIFWGEIPADPTQSQNDGAYDLSNGGWDNFQMWCECSNCGMLDIQFDGRSDRLNCKASGCSRSTHGDKGYSADSEKLLHAYAAARSARFEHGQKGATL